MYLKLKTESLKELLADFYLLTKIKIAIFDDKFQEIMAYPTEPCAFCTMIKDHPLAKARCDESDRKACKICRDTGQLYLYQCHAGLMEGIAPIKMNDLILGYIMFGQFTNHKNREQSKAEVIEKCKIFSMDQSNLSTAFDKLLYRNADQIRAASKIMESCACYLWISELMSVDDGNVIYQISNYISNNLQGDLNVEAICDRFLISRSKLYELSHQYFGMSIARYIRKKRVNYAAKLLKENKCLVSEAADKAGFEDYNYFSKVFKREMGCVPKDFRWNGQGS